MNAIALTEQLLSEAAGDTIFDRGVDYVRYVHGLRVIGSRATGSIQAKNVYLVELDWGSGELRMDCTCPHFGRGNFCKHVVALGLAAIDDKAGERADADGVGAGGLPAYLESLEAPALRDLVRELVARDEAVANLLGVRAAAGRTGTADASKALIKAVTASLAARGFVDYRRSFELARAAQDVLDSLQEHLDGGAADVVRPALLKALTRLRTITERADDSSGVIGDACQRAADLYARACREGSPEPVALARWLARFRDESPGWPDLELADFVDGLGERGLASYRKAVGMLAEKYRDSGGPDRSEINRMLLELADHDGDVDRAVAILESGDHAEYRGIVERLRIAGREAEALQWTDSAVAAGRISGQMGKGSYWLDPADVADSYLAVGREEDAVQVLRNNFAARAGVGTYDLLLRYAETLGHREAERSWALAKATDIARNDRFSGGAVRVELALAEDDLDAAWSAAEQFGAGHQWEQLAHASAVERPRQAADLHLPMLEHKLRFPDSKVYPEIAKTLGLMRRWYERAGDAGDFNALTARIREEYGRRPALMKALDQRGL